LASKKQASYTAKQSKKKNKTNKITCSLLFTVALQQKWPVQSKAASASHSHSHEICE
jgi:hypothetical protein